MSTNSLVSRRITGMRSFPGLDAGCFAADFPVPDFAVETEAGLAGLELTAAAGLAADFAGLAGADLTGAAFALGLAAAFGGTAVAFVAGALDGTAFAGAFTALGAAATAGFRVKAGRDSAGARSFAGLVATPASKIKAITPILTPID